MGPRFGPPVLCAALLLVISATPASADRLAASAASKTASVAEIHCNFVDGSRSVPDYATQPPSTSAKVRTLPTTVWLPPNPTQDHSRPLVLFAAGYDSYPSIYAPLLTAWAQAGFVVAAPTFPDENPGAIAAQGANTEGDLVNEPADLAFVGHALQDASERHVVTCPGVYGVIEPHVIVVGGHSDGASAAALFAFGTGADPQGVPLAVLRAGFSIQAALIFSGSELGTATYGAPNRQLPLLMVQSAGDHCNPEIDAVDLYREARVDERFFLLLRTAQHRTPFDGTDEKAFALVSATSIRFLRLSTRNARIGSGFIAYGDRDPMVGTVYTTPPVTPEIPEDCSAS